jgi:hypothetical protein
VPDGFRPLIEEIEFGAIGIGETQSLPVDRACGLFVGGQQSLVLALIICCGIAEML